MNYEQYQKIIGIVLFSLAFISCEKPVQEFNDVEVVTGKTSWDGQDVCISCEADTTVATEPVDTLELCCSNYDLETDTYHFCWTADGDCTECDSICSTWSP